MRLDIPSQARYALIYPSVAEPPQPIDTRSAYVSPETTAGPGGAAVIEGISDARKSYHATVFVGLEGLVGVELVDEQARPLGNCR